MKKIAPSLAAALLLCAAPCSADELTQYYQVPGKQPYIMIDKHSLTLSLMDSDGNCTATYGVACAVNYGNKTKRGDHKTPEGQFRINQLLNARGLSHDFGDGKGPVTGAYGPWFLRLDVPGFIDIGIHGTHLPESIGSRATEGCIRMKNEDMLELRKSVSVGMPVIIFPDNIPDMSYDGGSFDCFICYDKADSKSAEEIRTILESRGKKCLMHESGSREDILDVVKKCRKIVLVSSAEAEKHGTTKALHALLSYGRPSDCIRVGSAKDRESLNF